MVVELADVRRSGEPLRNYNFDLLIPNVPGGGNGDALRLRINTTNIPGFGNTPYESNHHGFTIKHAMRRVFPRTLTVEYEENSALLVLKTFRDWRELQFETNTGVQAPSDIYKTEGFLQILNESRVAIETIKLNGMWVEDVADSPLDGAGDAAVLLAITLSYDDWDFE